MRLFDCSCHFLLFFSFFFVAAAGGGCLSGDAIYGIDDQVSRYLCRGYGSSQSSFLILQPERDRFQLF